MFYYIKFIIFLQQQTFLINVKSIKPINFRFGARVKFVFILEKNMSLRILWEEEEKINKMWWIKFIVKCNSEIRKKVNKVLFKLLINSLRNIELNKNHMPIIDFKYFSNNWEQKNSSIPSWLFEPSHKRKTSNCDKNSRRKRHRQATKDNPEQTRPKTSKHSSIRKIEPKCAKPAESRLKLHNLGLTYKKNGQLTNL